MVIQEAPAILRWYAIHTNPKQEERAESNLRAWQVESFAPRVKQRRLNQLSGRASYVNKPLFPRYIFARFSPDMLQKVRYTRGVHSVVGIGNSPTPIEDELIEIIQSRRTDEGFIRMGDEFKTGDCLQVMEGPFRGFIGVFEHRMKDTDRIMILLKTVNYQSHLVIETDMIIKLD